nr:ABC transporter substrate-binding protein [uncultured Pseudogulbenkiania sp.]
MSNQNRLKFQIQCIAGVVAVAVTIPAVAATTLNVAGFGGNLQKDVSNTLWQPAAAKIGASLREESHDGSLAQVRIQVKSGKPGWDVVHLGSDDCSVGASEGLFEPLDYKVVNANGIPKEWHGANWIGTNTYSVVLAWRTDKYGANPPKNWRDFWNVKAFPGRRALSALPVESAEIALMADGVAKDKLYPLDVKRALASLQRIKPNISVWWTTGAQSAQLIKDGEVDMMAIYGSRVANVIKDGAPVSFTYQDGVLGSGCMAIPKGAAHAKLAQKFLAQVVSPEIQARIPTMMSYYGPVNSHAYEVAKLSTDTISKSNMSPANRSKQMLVNVEWWRTHIVDIREQYKELIAQ